MLSRFVKDRLRRGTAVSGATARPVSSGLVLDPDPVHSPDRDGRAERSPQGGMDAAYAAFRREYPTFDATARIDSLRATEYGRLDREQQVYLDYTGGGLYADSTPSRKCASTWNSCARTYLAIRTPPTRPRWR
jgi:hypothetical protein